MRVVILKCFFSVCVDEVEAKAPCNSESRENRMVSDKANLACAAFFNSEFEACGEVSTYILD